MTITQEYILDKLRNGVDIDVISEELCKMLNEANDIYLKEQEKSAEKDKLLVEASKLILEYLTLSGSKLTEIEMMASFSPEALKQSISFVEKFAAINHNQFDINCNSFDLFDLSKFGTIFNKTDK